MLQLREISRVNIVRLREISQVNITVETLWGSRSTEEGVGAARSHSLTPINKIAVAKMKKNII